MPIDSIIVSVTTIAIFAFFIAMLAWADSQTRNLRQLPRR